MEVLFNDFKKIYADLNSKLNDALRCVLVSGWYCERRSNKKPTMCGEDATAGWMLAGCNPISKIATS